MNKEEVHFHVCRGKEILGKIIEKDDSKQRCYILEFSSPKIIHLENHFPSIFEYTALNVTRV